MTRRAPRLKKRFNYFGVSRIIDESRKAREKFNLAPKTVARPRKREFRSFCDSKIEMKSQRATGIGIDLGIFRVPSGTGGATAEPQ